MYKLNNKFVKKNVNDGIILVDTKEAKNIYEFNDFGKEIIDNITLSKEEFIDKVTKMYDVKPNRVSKDYDEFIKVLLDSNIIEVANEE
jgi:hypothetical protein